MLFPAVLLICLLVFSSFFRRFATAFCKDLRMSLGVPSSCQVVHEAQHAFRERLLFHLGNFLLFPCLAACAFRRDCNLPVRSFSFSSDLHASGLSCRYTMPRTSKQHFHLRLFSPASLAPSACLSGIFMSCAYEWRPDDAQNMERSKLSEIRGKTRLKTK